MARTKQLAKATSQPKVKVERNASDGEITIKSEKSEIVKAPSSDARKRARKMMTPKKYGKDMIELSKKPYIFYRRPFTQLVREIAQDISKEFPEDAFPNGIRFDKKGLDVLQIITESYLHGMFEDTAMVAENSGRPTILKKDMQVVLGIYDRQRARPKTTLERELVELNEKKKTRTMKMKLKSEKLADDETIKTEQHSDDAEPAVENGKTHKIKKASKKETPEETTLQDDENVKPKKKIPRIKEKEPSLSEDVFDTTHKKPVSTKEPLPKLVVIKKDQTIKKMNSFAASSTEVDPSDL